MQGSVVPSMSSNVSNPSSTAVSDSPTSSGSPESSSSKALLLVGIVFFFFLVVGFIALYRRYCPEPPRQLTPSEKAEKEKPVLHDLQLAAELEDGSATGQTWHSIQPLAVQVTPSTVIRSPGSPSFKALSSSMSLAAWTSPPKRHPISSSSSDASLYASKLLQDMHITSASAPDALGRGLRVAVIIAMPLAPEETGMDLNVGMVSAVP
ncbi:unnamed protein product [Mycena citricolor]|uniref:Uncharacterized protein n=1 Tax=Mycena citricolor TaxID=2018698 RepID=A0AAD2GXX2_9AGAR|nr:unnamed protein product [Mycena citricolor]CAK5280897.1 unnamed protein product [Mycena citricolor]